MRLRCLPMIFRYCGGAFGGIVLPPGGDEPAGGDPAPEPVVPLSWDLSTHWSDEPDGRACSHCAMVW